MRTHRCSIRRNGHPGGEAPSGLGDPVGIVHHCCFNFKIFLACHVRITGVAADIVSCCFLISMDPSLVYLPTTSTVSGTELLVQVHGSKRTARLDTELAASSPGAIDQIHTMETFQAPFFVWSRWCALVFSLAANSGDRNQLGDKGPQGFGRAAGVSAIHETGAHRQCRRFSAWRWGYGVCWPHACSS